MQGRQVLKADLLGFSQWLEILGYNQGTVRYGPVRILEWIEWNQGQVSSESISAFFAYLEKRPNKNKAGGLSLASLRNYQTYFNLYSRYLLQTRGEILEVNISLQAQEIASRKVLTKQEIEKLYQATNDDPYGLRDRAMLAIYYGCGLRKSEGARLKIQDIRLESNLVYVQRGKHYRSRLVPLAQGIQKDLVNYLTIGRPMLIRGVLHEGLFVSRTGSWMSKSGLYEALQRLCRKAQITPVGLHCLRHSIATHLLQNGVPLKQIARFLGHRSIESTQIYTQLVDVCV